MKQLLLKHSLADLLLLKIGLLLVDLCNFILCVLLVAQSEAFWRLWGLWELWSFKI
jgi:hypothetical protein